MPLQNSKFRFLIQPVIAAVLLALWLFSNWTGFENEVPVRTDTFITNPYAIAIAVGFALAIAAARLRPIASYTLIGISLLVQVLFWPARFSQESWSAYLGLLALAAAGGMFGGRIFRWVALGLSIAFVVVISALLDFPALSMSGIWGLINGKPASSPEVFEGFVAWAIVAAAFAAGCWWIGTKLARQIALASADGSAANAVRGGAAIASLSGREKEIFVLAADGMTNREIASRASIEESTVKSHLNSISTKLHLTSRSQLVAYAYQHGVLVVDIPDEEQVLSRHP